MIGFRSYFSNRRLQPLVNRLFASRLFSEENYKYLYPDVRAQSGHPLWHYVKCGAREGRQPHPAFLPDYYLGQLPETERPAARENPLLHYLDYGAPRGLKSHPLFDPAHYRAQCGDLLPAGIEPLGHYLAESNDFFRSPHALFNRRFYLRQCRDDWAPHDPLYHYLVLGAPSGATPHPLFSPAYYLSQIEDDRERSAATPDPLVHYLLHADQTQIHPHPLFDPEYYAAQLPGGDPGRQTPLIHYATQGARLGLRAHPLFVPAHYLTQLSDPDEREAAQADPLGHYLEFGEAAGHRPNPIFDPAHYRRQVAGPAAPAVPAGGGSWLAHFARYGSTRKFVPHPLFNPDYYRRRHPEVAAAGLNPLVHYLEHGGHQGHQPHPLFDTAYYQAQRPDLSAADNNALIHYLSIGAALGLDPHPLFSTRHYLRQRPGLLERGGNPLLHYLESGAAQNLDPHPLFATAYYRVQCPELAETGENPLLHFLREGDRQTRRPHPLFDPGHYFHRHPQLVESGVNPLRHYLTEGEAAGWEPNPLFEPEYYRAQLNSAPADNLLCHFIERGAFESARPHPAFEPDYYRRQHPEIAAAGLNPLAHYLEHGGRQGHRPHPLFDPAYYRRQCPEATRADGNALIHYLAHGQAQGLKPHPLFDPAYYRRENADAPETERNPLRHFLVSGAAEGRRPHPLFATAYYLAQNPEVAARNENPLVHYLLSGSADGRRPNPLFDPAHYRAAYLGGATEPEALIHFVETGAAAGHRPDRLFDPYHYLSLHPELPALGVELHAHALERLPASRRDGASPEAVRAFLAGQPHPEPDEYAAWLRANAWNDRRAAALRERLAGLSARPIFSVVMPVHNPPAGVLEAALASVAAQVYPHWELCLADDASSDPQVRAVLDNWAARDARVRLVRRPRAGHISRATNDAAAQATGEFILLLDHDDTLAPDALGELALHLAEHPETDLLYADEDHLDAQGQRRDPVFKPDWSPELLYSFMYLCHPLGIRRELFAELGGLRVGFEGAQDHDLALRAAERARRVGHVPLVLYHWRVLPGSTAASGAAKPYAAEAGRRAVQEALERRGIKATVARPDWAVAGHLNIYSLDFPDSGPEVAIVIPTRNRRELVEKCLASLETTTYRNYKIYIADNGSDEPATREYLAGLPHKVLRLPGPGEAFNFAWLNNRAVEELTEEFVLFLNNDTEVLEPRWLSHLAGRLQMPGVGAVGARLLFPDGTVQHAGVWHGVYQGLCDHAFKFLKRDEPGYLGLARVMRNCSAVTAACLLTRREEFLKLGGFDEKNFGVAYNDIDFCFRLAATGQRIVYCPEAELTHHEGKSRGFLNSAAEEGGFSRKYHEFRDPYRSPHQRRESLTGAFAARGTAFRPARPLRLAVWTPALDHSDPAQFALELAAGLRERQAAEPVFLTPAGGGLSAELEAAGLPRQVAPEAPATFPDAGVYDRHVQALTESLSRSGAQVVLANTVFAAPTVEAAARAGLPVVWSIHANTQPLAELVPLGETALARAAAACGLAYQVTFTSGAGYQTYQPLNHWGNFLAVPGALDDRRLEKALKKANRNALRADLGIGEGQLLALVPGPWQAQSGREDLIRAAAELPAELLGRVRFVLLGAPSDDLARGEAARLAELPSERRAALHLIEDESRTPALCRAADLLLYPARAAGYPRAILAALAQGLPILTTPAGGIVEQVRPTACRQYEPGRFDQLGRLLEWMIGQPSQRTDLGRQGREAYGVLLNFPTLLDTYRDLLQEAVLAGPWSPGDQVAGTNTARHRRRAAFIERLFVFCRGRRPEPTELKAQNKRLADQPAAAVQVAAEFLLAADFAPGDDDAFLTGLYRTLFGRAPDAAGFGQWRQQLTAGLSRRQLFDVFVRSPEFKV